jgi:hypothetical protein
MCKKWRQYKTNLHVQPHRNLRWFHDPNSTKCLVRIINFLVTYMKSQNVSSFQISVLKFCMYFSSLPSVLQVPFISASFICGEGYNLRSSSLCNFLRPALTSSVSTPDILLSALPKIGIASGLYSGSDRFESWTEHHYSAMSWVFLVFPGKNVATIS